MEAMTLEELIREVRARSSTLTMTSPSWHAEGNSKRWQVTVSLGRGFGVHGGYADDLRTAILAAYRLAIENKQRYGKSQLRKVEQYKS